MNRPCVTRSAAKTPRLGANARSVVGIDSRHRLMKMPKRRSMRWLWMAMARPAAAMPKVLD